MFPTFNIHSTPLLILVTQGLIFSFLLFRRYFHKKNIPDLLLALILLVTCYQRTTYTIGFMSWYDTFRNTKVNYYLIPTAFVFAPLLFLYIKSVLRVGWNFSRKELLHFIPAGIFLIYRVFILTYDAFQPGFSETQNGVLMQSLNMGVAGAVFELFMFIITILYLAFSLQLYYQYRIKIEQFYSNTFNMELNWLRNFLLIYSILFIYGAIQMVVGNNLVDLHYTHKWWLEFLYAASIIYVGIKGYFTPVEKLKDVTFDTLPSLNSEGGQTLINDDDLDLVRLKNAMEKERLFLDPDLTLKNVADHVKMASSELSMLINRGTGKNFNDFINAYRVEEVKKQIINGEHISKSLLGIAYNCGFNSKATFNRAFKKLTHISPSEYISKSQADTAR